MEKLLQDKVAIITGAGRGIGKSVALLFAKEGANVVINDIDEDVAKQVKAEILENGGQAEIAIGSVADIIACEKIIKTAVDSFGKLDILINNAGTTRDKTVHQMSDENWHFIMDIILKGAFNLIRAASPYMRDVAKKELEQKIIYHRKIVNISSIAGVKGNAGQANYASAKAGLVGLTKTIAREWGRFNINVNCIAPGFIDTRLTQPKSSADDQLGLPPGAAEMAKMMIPLGRIGKPEDIANACLFFSSNLSDWISGQVLVVDGGMI